MPVINGLTDTLHPCQVLADLLTYLEHRGDIAGKRVAFVGRLDPVKGALLLVEAMATDNGLGWHNVVSVRISAQVWAQPVPLELLLRTEVDLETGQVALAELAA